MQINFACLVADSSDERKALHNLLHAKKVEYSIIHIAGIVDTRENPRTRNLLQLVNFKATEIFAGMAAKS